MTLHTHSVHTHPIVSFQAGFITPSVPLSKQYPPLILPPPTHMHPTRVPLAPVGQHYNGERVLRRLRPHQVHTRDRAGLMHRPAAPERSGRRRRRCRRSRRQSDDRGGDKPPGHHGGEEVRVEDDSRWYGGGDGGGVHARGGLDPEGGTGGLIGRGDKRDREFHIRGRLHERGNRRSQLAGNTWMPYIMIFIFCHFYDTGTYRLLRVCRTFL